jgi:hypothetical protein
MKLLEKIFGKKIQISAIKGMLTGLGLDMSKIIPEVEIMLVDWFRKRQVEAGAPLVLTGYLDETESHFIICLHKQTETGLQPWKQFPLSDFQNILNNLENLENGANNTDIAQLPVSPTIKPETTGATDTSNTGTEPAGASATGTGTAAAESGQ